jgi:ferredoxin
VQKEGNSDVKLDVDPETAEAIRSCPEQAISVIP